MYELARVSSRSSRSRIVFPRNFISAGIFEYGFLPTILYLIRLSRGTFTIQRQGLRSVSRPLLCKCRNRSDAAAQAHGSLSFCSWFSAHAPPIDAQIFHAMLHFEDTQSTPTPAGHSYIVLLIFLAVRSETWLHRPLKPKAEDKFRPSDRSQKQAGQQEYQCLLLAPSSTDKLIFPLIFVRCSPTCRRKPSIGAVLTAHCHDAQVDSPKNNELILRFRTQLPQTNLGTVDVTYYFNPVKCSCAIFS